MKSHISAAAAAVLLSVTGMQSYAADADALPILRADINGDYVISAADMVLMSKFILGSGELSDAEAERADFDADGIIDTFDLIGMRTSYVRNSVKDPKGTFISGDGNNTHFYWFGERGKGVVADISSEVVSPFSMDKWGSGIDITFSSEEQVSASISWLDDEHFYLKQYDMPPELFTLKSDVRFDSGPFLTGEYISDAGRSFKLGYFSGSCDGEEVTVLPMGTKAQFIYGDGSSETGSFTRTDQNHFTLVWEDGSAEHFTRREITVKDGITYVNGILIANKTYSLPLTYAPGGLLPEFNTAFAEMQADAKRDGISLSVCSGYRSYSYQSQLYNGYVARDGKAKADTYSARPGHSEHQTGLAADINYAGDWFNSTPEAKWLAENCHKYGFIIRYPYGKDDITGYKYEGWHIRYLGKETAKLVHDSGLTLEEYLGIDSKYSY